ncbi:MULTISPECIES: aconitate hydratase AcnA [unclassified Sinorhizobium]|uniref:aconitate hydratase AcnA n=1 Tax=unclassified Sinorhizobium TaxID=2613772 RepID=UPI0024C39668|nr:MULTISPECIES: aconitate hydratase AcnA [unclassified Sinorhizobium]MDK1378571.1 aconitate hydratase AcnA [Sinorhizobium sp. 6-70]MDK1480532.1 aconitate hydratase AcnA [Sinorhizobium sp. 6-117]
MAALSIQTRAGRLRAADLRQALGPALTRLPWLMRIFFENALRTGSMEADSLRETFFAWLKHGRSDVELPFHPARLLMHDTTCVPALVDIAAMRDAVAEAGGDPSMLKPVLPVDVSVDHSVAVDWYGRPGAREFNMQREMERNEERYRLMKWATNALPGVRVHPPGTGIMHTMNLEQLATVVTVQDVNGERWAIPDTLIGTDSHTPMINGIGVLAWGVGGLEAESVFFGMPVMLRLPDVIGVHLTGTFRPGVMSTDLALAVTHLLRVHQVSGEFVEFFGDGVSALSCGDRAVIANMAPEYGASSGYFPIDRQTIRYLRETGRSEQQCEIVESVARAQGLWFNPDVQPRYTRVLQLDLSTLSPIVAGPRRPQDRLPLHKARQALADASGRTLEQPEGDIPDGAVAIAAITSCTNTSDPKLLIAAGLIARKARQFGLKPPHWVKTSLAPGSPAAERLLKRAGLLDDLEAVGFNIVGFGCTTCIGNSGPLHPDMDLAVSSGAVTAAILSGNRNFPGRVHAKLEYGFLASPPLVIAFSLVGRVVEDIARQEFGHAPDGRPILLKDLWPSEEEIAAVLGASACSTDFADAFADAERSDAWKELAAPESVLFPWDEHSTYIRRPPFASQQMRSRLGKYSASPLVVLGDDMTTDHISPAGQIDPSSYAGHHLIESGDPANNLNVYAARRGNWQAMVRGLFDNRTAHNLLLDQTSASTTIHWPSGETGPIWEIAQKYQSEGRSVVIVAGERYGAGSSRDWAAKGVALLGVRAVLARSFERIHRSNLINMGVLPIRLPDDAHPQSLAIGPDTIFMIDAAKLSPRCTLTVTMEDPSGPRNLDCSAAIETDLELQVLRAGGMIPLIIARSLTSRAVEPGFSMHPLAP